MNVIKHNREYFYIFSWLFIITFVKIHSAYLYKIFLFFNFDAHKAYQSKYRKYRNNIFLYSHANETILTLYTLIHFHFFFFLYSHNIKLSLCTARSTMQDQMSSFPIRSKKQKRTCKFPRLAIHRSSDDYCPREKKTKKKRERRIKIKK